MARANAPLVTFNRGVVSKLGLARVDLDRMRLSGEIQRNFIPRTLGSMMLRPGLEYIGQIYNSSTAQLIPFVRSLSQTALVELTSTNMRVWVASTGSTGIALVTREGTTAAITLGTFSSTLIGGWTDSDESGATSEYFGSTSIKTGSSDFLSLVGTPFARAARRQTITSSAGVHGLTFVIERGRVFLRIGSSAGGDDYFGEQSLRPGSYSIGVESTGNFMLEFSANTQYRSLVDSVTIESSGAMTLASTWSSSDFALLRWDQSADVIFAGAKGFRPKRIERYSSESWASVDYQPEDGPFRTINVTNKRLTGSTLTGNIDLTCDKAFFNSGHVGALFRLTSQGQSVTVSPAAADNWSNPIRVSGVEDSREISILVRSTAAWDATVRVQRSVGEVGSWENIDNLVFTSTLAGTVIDMEANDGLDNQIIFYRIGVGSTYTSGIPICTLNYDKGGLNGIVRIDRVISSTESSASVLVDLGSTLATDTWEEGAWSNFRGYPSAVALHEGRLWWAGKSNIWATISNQYESFNQEVTGDSGTISRTIGAGPIDDIQWLMSLGRLIIGTDAREVEAKTSSLEEPLTPTNFNLRDISTQGAAVVPAVKIDRRMLFVQSAGIRVYEVGPGQGGFELATGDRTVVVPEIGEPGLGQLVVQRKPDTRIHSIRSSTDGTVAMLVSDPGEDVAAWIEVESSGKVNGIIEQAAVLPSVGEDSVYYVIKREINGSTVRYLERWATEWDARGDGQRASGLFTITDGSSSTASKITSITVDGTEILADEVFFTTSGVATAALIVGSINASPWNVDALTYNTKTFDLSGTAAGVFVADDFSLAGNEKYLYLPDNGGGQASIHQLTMSTPGDISTLTYTGEYDITATNWTRPEFQDGPYSIFVREDGRKCFITCKDDFQSAIWSFDFGTPYDITTLGNRRVRDIDDDLGSNNPGEILQLSTDGKHLYVGNGGDTNNILHYTLWEPWNPVSMSLKEEVEVNVDYTDWDNQQNLESLDFDPTGTKMFLSTIFGEWVTEFALDTPWEITASNVTWVKEISIDVIPPVDNETAVGPLNGEDPEGIQWSQDGLKFYFLSGRDFFEVDASLGLDFQGKVGHPEGAVTIQTILPGSDHNGKEVKVTTTGDVVLDSGSFTLLGGRALAQISGRTNRHRMADSHMVHDSSIPFVKVTGADHLTGSTIVAWADGKDAGTYTVSSTGTFTLASCATSVMFGLPYSGLYKSAKLAYGAQVGTALTQKKKVNHLGLVLADTHARGLQYGPSTDRLDPMPSIEGGAVVSTDKIHEVYDEASIEFPGSWDTDSRIVLKGAAPRPVTVLGAIVQVNTKEKV